MKSPCSLHNLWYYSTRKNTVRKTDKLIEFTNTPVLQQHTTPAHYHAKRSMLFS